MFSRHITSSAQQINHRTWAEVIAHGGCACESHLELRTSKLPTEQSSVLKKYPEDDIGNDTLNRTSRIGALLEDQPHKERAPERSGIAELAGKKAGLNALPMNIAREANDQ